MPLLRFSAVEHRGLFIPATEKELVTDAAAMVLRTVTFGIPPQRMERSKLIDVTPPYWQRHANAYWIQVEDADPPEGCQVHIMPRSEGGGSFLVLPAGELSPHQAVRTICVPSESIAFPLLSPDFTRLGLRLHELILPLSEERQLSLDSR